MVHTLLATVALLQPAPATGRFELGERLKGLDAAWVAVPDRTRRAAAVNHVSASVMSFFAGRFSPAAESLDRARAALQSRPLAPEDAISVRFDPPFAEPGARARLIARWVYVPREARPVELRAGRTSVVLAPGRTVTLEVRPTEVQPDLALTPEIGWAMPYTLNGSPRTAYLSIVKSARRRIEALGATKDPTAESLAELLATYVAAPERAETDVPVIQHLFTAEALNTGRTRLADLPEVALARHGETRLRAAFPPEFVGPKGRKKDATVVIALHGAGGSENLFFEGYGGGMAVREALRRGWIFLSPRATGRAAADALDWLRTVRGVEVARVLLMGHSMGGGLALRSGGLTPKPAAVALFAPAAQSLPAELEGVPIYLAVGKQEIPMLAASAQRLGQALEGRAGSEFESFDPCEHLMIVADALPSAFRFFDAVR